MHITGSWRLKYSECLDYHVEKGESDISRYVVFDFDGTIVDSMSLMIKIGHMLGQKYGYNDINEKTIRELSEMPIRDRLLKIGIPFYKVPGLIMQVLHEYKNNLSDLMPFPGMYETIYSLKEKGYELAIISSNSESNIKQFLINNNMNVFNHIYSSKGLLGKHNTIQGLLRKLKIHKSNMVYVGDELRDIEASRKAGVRVISVLWGFDAEGLIKSAKPDYTAVKPEDIINAVENMLS